MNVILENGALSILVLFSGIILIIILRSENMRRQLKKGLFFLLVLLGLGFAYYFFSGKSPADIPSAINSYLNGPQAAPEKNSKRYYRDPEEHYGEKLIK